MNNLQLISIIFIGTMILLLSYLFFGLKTSTKPSPEISLDMISPFGKVKSSVVAASCGFTLHGSSDEYSSCTYQIYCCYGGNKIVTGTSQCGGTCGGSSEQCSTHPSNGQTCTSAQNICGNVGSGTIDACGNCSATVPSVDTCTVTNVCGHSKTGYLCNGVCSAVADNSTCISNFKVTSDQVNPNGSVEFSWKIEQAPGVGSKCGFVDLTTATPRPIPGLQNLDPNTDRIRISNIQTTTRFCLVCQFYNLVSNATLGDAAAHQWIRVIRIGED